MTRFGTACVILCTLMALIMPASAATSRMPYGSYLTRPVTDAHDFARLLRQDRVVAQRFADHFGMSNDAIADYIEEHGRVQTLSRAGSYVEFFIDKRGKAHRHFKRLRPKHRVLFVDGTPVLDLECGNPMTKSLPKMPEKPKPKVAKAPPPPVVQPPPPVEQPAPPAPPAPPEVQITEEPPAPVAPPVPEVEVLPGPQVEYPTPPETPLPSRRPNFLLPILIGAGIIALDDDDNPPPGPPPPGPVIPEASTLALGLGGTGFILTWYRMRRR